MGGYTLRQSGIMSLYCTAQCVWALCCVWPCVQFFVTEEGLELEVESGWPCVEVSSFRRSFPVSGRLQKKGRLPNILVAKESTPRPHAAADVNSQFILLDMSPMSQGTQDFLPVSVGGAGCPVSSRRCQCFRSVSKVGVSLTGRQALHLFREIATAKAGNSSMPKSSVAPRLSDTDAAGERASGKASTLAKDREKREGHRACSE